MLLGRRALDMDVRRQDVAALNEGGSEQDMVNVEVSWLVIAGRSCCYSL